MVDSAADMPWWRGVCFWCVEEPFAQFYMRTAPSAFICAGGATREQSKELRLPNAWTGRFVLDYG